MPTAERVKSLITRVEQHDYVGAIAHFYHPDAWMQENFGEVRKGRDKLIANEMEIVLRYGSTKARKVERFAISGDLVFINWQVDLEIPGLGHRLLDEVAMQIWEGDRVKGERFYYDPAQIRPAAT